MAKRGFIGVKERIISLAVNGYLSCKTWLSCWALSSSERNILLVSRRYGILLEDSLSSAYLACSMGCWECTSVPSMSIAKPILFWYCFMGLGCVEVIKYLLRVIKLWILLRLGILCWRLVDLELNNTDIWFQNDDTVGIIVKDKIEGRN